MVSTNVLSCELLLNANDLNALTQLVLKSEWCCRTNLDHITTVV